MPIELTNALVSSQSYIHKVSMFFHDITIMVYQGNILMLQCDLFQNIKYIQKVFITLLKTSLYMNWSKYLFSVKLFFSFILKDNVIEMEVDCISTISNYLEPKSVYKIESCFDICHFSPQSYPKVFKNCTKT